MRLRHHTLALSLSLALGLAGSGMVTAQQAEPGMTDHAPSPMASGTRGGQGPGIMGGYGMGQGMGPGMMGGYGMGQGMGPGMMGGHGMGQGMGQGMGPGMMGGHGMGQGMGPGMMGGYGMNQGMGLGMMGGHGMGYGMGQGMGTMGEPQLPQLDDEQRRQLRELRQSHRPAQFERMARLMNLHDDLLAEMHAERPDPEAVRALHQQMAELRGEMLVEQIRLRNAIHDLLPEASSQ